MIRILLALLLGLLAASPASAQKTKAAIQTEINSLFADNTTGLLTPLKLRTVTTDIVNSYVDWLVCTTGGGLVYWSGGTPTCLLAGTAGQFLKTNGTSAPSWADSSTALLAGTGITITGTTPATISLTNQIAAGGPTGTATAIPVVTYNAQGQLTAVSTIFPFNNTGTTSTVLHGNAAGNPAFGSVVSADMSITTTSCTNQFVTAISAGGVGTCTTDALASAQHANQGTTTTLLHGNAAGNPAFGQVVAGDVAASLFASTANYYAGTSSTTLIAPNIIYPSEVTVTFGATTTFDFSTFINAVVTLTANITTMTFSNITAGKSGTLTFIQDGTGSRTTVWNSNLKFSGGTTPSLSTAANAVDVLSYTCRTATNCPATLLKDVR